MSYQVLARKYRPQRFADVVGQEHVTQTLAHAIEQSRIAHAYLFVGPRGTGKTTLARIFAKCLNCTGGPKVDFAPDDPRCQEIAEGRSLDVLEIDGASNRGIEEVRALRDTVKYAPATSRFKIYIIDEVHMLTKEAFNALLKTLEEPPAHVKFMFATTEPEKVLPTILSRCQRFDLRRIPASLIVRHLAQIAKLEKVEIDEAALHAIARGADGGMRDAESALDQLISFCGNQIVEADVLSIFGLTARTQLLAVTQAILAGDAAAALRELDSLAKNGKDLSRFLSDLLHHFRNLLLFQVARADSGVLDVSEAEAAVLADQAKAATVDGLTRILDLLSEYEGRLRDAASKRILIEVALLKAIQARTAVSIDTVLQKLQSLRSAPATSQPAVEARAEAEAPPRPEPAKVTKAASAQAIAPAQPIGPAQLVAVAPVEASPAAPKLPQVQSAPESTAAGATEEPTELLTLWRNVIDAVGRVSLFARTYLLEAHPVSLTKNALTIGFAQEFADHLGLVDNLKNRTLIQSKLDELGFPGVQVRFIRAEPPPGWVRPDPKSQAAVPVEPVAEAVPDAEVRVAAAPAPPVGTVSKEEFKNDPLIKQALELFKGQIVEVRT